ncbi:cytochrome P450 [Myxococcota bacterium]|nr:cytochrome P450 [Myxococcota bacterium]
MNTTSPPHTPISLGDIDLTQPESYRGGFPHDVFSTLRREAPIWWHPAVPKCVEVDSRGFWVLSKHEDIQMASRNPDIFSAKDGPTLRGESPSGTPMLTNMDGASHIRQRQLISAGFTPRMIGKLEEQARGWAISIVEDALERETCNFVDDVAYQLPMHMIADIVGIPKEDRARIFQIANDFMQCTDPEHPVPVEEHGALVVEMYRSGQKLSAAKRARAEDDVWSILTSAEIKSEDGTLSGLSDLELDGFFVLLTVAGSETTRNAISLGLLALLENPGQLEALRSDPSLLKTATEEIIRFTSPVSYFRRTVMRDTEIRGVPMAAGDRVSLWYPSGNRDEDAFEDPFQFDVTRQRNEQVSFGGGGPHFCMGAHLARREIMIMFEELLARVAEFEILAAPRYGVQGIGNPVAVSLNDLPLRLKAR